LSFNVVISICGVIILILDTWTLAGCFFLYISLTLEFPLEIGMSACAMKMYCQPICCTPGILGTYQFYQS